MARGMDEHISGQETTGRAMKRRGILAAAAVVVAGITAKQTSQSVLAQRRIRILLRLAAAAPPSMSLRVDMAPAYLRRAAIMASIASSVAATASLPSRAAAAAAPRRCLWGRWRHRQLRRPWRGIGRHDRGEWHERQRHRRLRRDPGHGRYRTARRQHRAERQRGAGAEPLHRHGRLRSLRQRCPRLRGRLRPRGQPSRAAAGWSASPPVAGTIGFAAAAYAPASMRATSPAMSRSSATSG